MDSQKESSSSFYKTTYTDQSDSEADNTNVSSTTKLISSKKKRSRNKSSFVWKYFKVIGDKDVYQIEIRKDKKCGQEYLHDKSTSNMISHLRVQHNIVDNKRLKLPLPQSTNIKSYLDNEEPGEIDDGNNTDSEQPLIVNTVSKVLHLIKDCSTRWNSEYHSWKRLLKLKDVIIWLEANLKISRNSEDKKDEFSAENYSTLSVVYPIIEVLKFKFAIDPNLPLIEDSIDKKNESDIDSDNEYENITDLQETLSCCPS
ncbi:7218_t:CDS:2 [Dentiscutata erythropus]|uniref:7218_t:CDS:1 n=1 Tax=Dentiscutata erythropus TaxID=1348616 RepID=A0A9N9NX01_9GLOM|nr:7218_t:CDS:2 [Dentiscutata erythropus]